MKGGYTLPTKDARVVAEWLQEIARAIADGDIGTCDCKEANGEPSTLAAIRRIMRHLPPAGGQLH